MYMTDCLADKTPHSLKDMFSNFKSDLSGQNSHTKFSAHLEYSKKNIRI